MHRSKDHSPRLLARVVRPAVVIALLCGLALPVAASASGKSSRSTAHASAQKDLSLSDPVGTPAQVQSLLDNAFGPGTVKVGQLQKVAQQAFKIAAKPPTAAETKIVENCLKVEPLPARSSARHDQDGRARGRQQPVLPDLPRGCRAGCGAGAERQGALLRERQLQRPTGAGQFPLCNFRGRERHRRVRSTPVP